MDAKKPDTETPDFTKEEVERRALDAARRLLATPKTSKPAKSEPKEAAERTASRDATPRNRQP